MPFRKRKLTLWIVAGLPIALLFGAAFLTWRAVRQEQLNAELYTALVPLDVRATQRLLDQGADPNTRYPLAGPSEPIGWRDVPGKLWARLSHREDDQANTCPAIAWALKPFDTHLLLRMYDPRRSGADTDDTNAAAVTLSLLKHGARPDALAPGGRSPLQLAAEYDYPATAEVLLRYHANLELLDNEGHTPLEIAARGSHQTANVLLDHGANARAKMAVFEAVRCSDFVLAARLVQSGGSAAGTFDHACESGSFSLESADAHAMDYLLSHGVNANCIVYHDKRTLLHWAIETDAPLDTIRVILAHGVSVSARDETGKTPIDLARKRGDRRLVQLLVAADSTRATRRIKELR
jgi:ankyrin repeat protein